MVFRFMRRPLLACLTALAMLLFTATPAWADFVLPPLPYAAEALEPAIDAATMTIHHDRHHGAYVANLPPLRSLCWAGAILCTALLYSEGLRGVLHG